jgi:5-methylcytosine-specific restriction endonuclease McrA
MTIHIKNISKYNKKTKGSKYTGVYKCPNKNLYYAKVYENNHCIKSKFFRNEAHAAKFYDNIISKNFPNSIKINFKKNINIVKPIVKIKNILKPVIKTKNINISKSKNIVKTPIKQQRSKTKIVKNDSKRPLIKDFIKVLVYSRQNEKCNLCKKNLGVGRVVDHILPRSLGGLDNINNYQAICDICNKWKTYSFDHYLRDKIKNNNGSINFIVVLKMLKQQYDNFFGDL